MASQTGAQGIPGKSVGELRLHVDEAGKGWYTDGSSIRDVPDFAPERFVLLPVVQQAQVIRVLGTHASAPLIRALYVTKKRDPSCQIKIASPRVGLRSGGEDAELVFSRMASVTWPSSVGGWRLLTDVDFVIYSLITEMQKSKGNLTESALLYLKQHPAWPAISFIFQRQLEPACRLLTEIADPRWHEDPDYPGRLGGLRDYLGFGNTPRAAAEHFSAALSLLRGHGGACPEGENKHLYRTMLTIATWYGAFAKYSALSKELGEHLTRPEAFLLRRLHNPVDQDDQDIRFVKANHKFIRFVKEVWLDNLYPSRHYRKLVQKLGRKHPERVLRYKMLCPRGYARTLFAPEHFFKMEDAVVQDEVDAWKAHVSKLRRTRRKH